MMKMNNIDKLIKTIDPDLIDDDLLNWFNVLTSSSTELSEIQQSLIQKPIITKSKDINDNDDDNNNNNNNNLMEIEKLQPVVNKDLLVEVILKLILDDDLAFPKWVGNNFNQFRLDNIKLISPPEDMIQTLKHIPMPVAVHAYNEFQKSMKFNDNDNNNDNYNGQYIKLQEVKCEIQNEYESSNKITSNNGKKMEWDVDVIMRDDSNEAENVVDSFFSSMDTNKNSTISLCKLADINHRLKRAKKNSDDRLSRQIQIEIDRNESYSKDLTIRKENIKNYIDDSKETEVYTFVRQLKVGLARVHQELPKHIDEVENFKVLLDEITSSNDVLADTIDTIRSYYGTILSQRESMLKICELRFEIESYNFLTSEQRLIIYKRLERYIDDIYNVILKDQVEKAISIILEALIKIKVNSKSHVALNTCMEAITLWKKYAGDNVKFASKFLTLEKKINKELKSIKITSKGSYPKIDNNTVILYFKSNLSESNHSQYSNRMNDCLGTLMTKVKNENNSISSNKRLQRTLTALDTNDVISSPAWCLYLTHSAHYLSKLFETVELSDRNNNLKFPLLFNADGPTSDIQKFDDKSSRSLKTLRSSERNKEEKPIPECISEFIDDEESTVIFQQLQQQYGDETILRISGFTMKEEEEENELTGSKRKRIENPKSDKKSKTNEEKIIEIGNLVSTPYGEGRVVSVVRNKYNQYIGEAIRVQLKWGMGHFNNLDGITVIEAFRFIEKLPYKQTLQLIAQANNLTGDDDDDDDDSTLSLGKTTKYVNQNKFLYNLTVLLLKNGISITAIGKALGVSFSNISNWMLGKDTAANSRVEYCFKKWLYYFDFEKIIEKRFGIDFDGEDDNEEPERKKNLKEEIVIDLIGESGKNKSANDGIESVNGMIFANMTDTLHINKDDMNMALQSAGIACRAIDIVMTSMNTNIFCCTHPPGHHVSRHGPTIGCQSTGFGLLNNAAIASFYARINWGIEKIAIVDIDASFGNGTAEIFQGDNRTFFGCVHMIYGVNNEGVKSKKSSGFFPASLGCTKEANDNYLSVGVQPDKLIKSNNGSKSIIIDDDIYNLVGPKGFRKAVDTYIVNKMEAFKPELLIISSGFNGYHSDPFGGELGLDLDDYEYVANVLVSSMEKINGVGKSKIISILEGGYDTSSGSQGLSNCITSFVKGLRI